MINQSNVHQKRVNSFQRGGDVLSGSRVDNDVTIGAGELTRHNKSHNTKGSARLGQLMPVDIMNVLPNENFRVRLSNTVQFEPLNKPILDNLVTKLHCYSVNYKQIFGDAWEMFFKGGKTGSYRKELPFFDLTSANSGMLQRTATTSGSVQSTLYGIAFLSWAFAHHMKVMDVVRWCSTNINESDPQSAVVFDTERLKIVLETCFGKGSLLDQFNLGVGAFDWRVDGDTPTRYGNFNIPNCIPVDRLLAYQLIVNKYYRIDDYSFDYFGDVEDLGAEMYSLDVEIDPANKIGLFLQSSALDEDFHYGAILANLDKISTGEGSSHDFVDKGSTCHFTIKNGISVYGGISPSLDPSSNQQFYYSRSAMFLAWLLAMHPVPVEKDYLTMILPRTQRGIVESIGNIPLRSSASQVGLASLVVGPDNKEHQLNTNGNILAYGPLYEGVYPSSLYSVFDMDTLRYINAATKLAEKMNLVGSDYGEQMLAEFGIKPSYANMDKPIYLGGLKTTPRVDKVTSTADTSSNFDTKGKDLGVYSGDATQFADGSYSFVAGDFGFVITIMSTVPEVSYSRFIDRNAFNFFDRFNWFHKAFEDLTEQHLYAQEFKGNDTMRLANMCAGRVAPTESDVIGYVPREQHLRTIPNTVHGEMIPSLGGEDDIVWTMARDFNGVNEFTKNDILYNSVDAPENSRIFTFSNIVEYPPMKFECGFGVDVLSPVGRITLPITI